MKGREGEGRGGKGEGRGEEREGRGEEREGKGGKGRGGGGKGRGGGGKGRGRGSEGEGRGGKGREGGGKGRGERGEGRGERGEGREGEGGEGKSKIITTPVHCMSRVEFPESYRYSTHRRHTYVHTQDNCTLCYTHANTTMNPPCPTGQLHLHFSMPPNTQTLSSLLTLLHNH